MHINNFGSSGNYNTNQYKLNTKAEAKVQANTNNLNINAKPLNLPNNIDNIDNIGDGLVINNKFNKNSNPDPSEIVCGGFWDDVVQFFRNLAGAILPESLDGFLTDLFNRGSTWGSKNVRINFFISTKNPQQLANDFHKDLTNRA